MSDLWGQFQRSGTGLSWKVGHIWNTQPCLLPFFPHISKCVLGPTNRSTMGVMRVRGTGSTTLCNWFSKPESSEIAAHMELNCGVQPYRHSHNPLPILQQPPWQTGGAEADNPLSKQVHIAVIAHCSPSMALIGLAHRSASEPSPEHLLLSCDATLQLGDKMVL